MLDGHRIANLAKHTDYRPAGQDGDEEEEKQRNAQLDDYVLHKLFKKSGMLKQMTVQFFIKFCMLKLMRVDQCATCKVTL